MRVPVPLPVAQIIHQTRWRVPNVQRHGQVGMLTDVCLCLAVGPVHGVALGCRGKIDRGLRNPQVPFRGSQEVVGLTCRQGHRERPGVRIPDVF